MTRNAGERRRGRAAVVAICGVVLVAVGAVVGQYLLPNSPPKSLSRASAETTFGVEEVGFDDARTVQLSLSIEEDRKLTFPLDGRVTSTSCVVGGQITSGQIVAEVSGKRVLALNTSIPLWESRKPGDEGDDVDSLRQELNRLGSDLADTGPVNSAVLEALARLLTFEGETPGILEEVTADQIMWMPQLTVTMLKCVSKVADSVKVGDEFGTVEGSLAEAHIAPMPTGLASGARALKVAGLEVSVDESGVVSSPEGLASIASSADYQAMRNSSSGGAGGDDTGGGAGGSGVDSTRVPTMVAVLALTPETTAWAVPASTVYEVVGDAGCITSNDKSISVKIVGSSLGKTYVLPAQESAAMPPKVDAPGTKPRSCPAPQ